MKKADFIRETLISEEVSYDIIKTSEKISFETISKLLSHEQKRVKKLSDITENIAFFFTDEIK